MSLQHFPPDIFPQIKASYISKPKQNNDRGLLKYSILQAHYQEDRKLDSPSRASMQTVLERPEREMLFLAISEMASSMRDPITREETLQNEFRTTTL